MRLGSQFLKCATLFALGTAALCSSWPGSSSGAAQAAQTQLSADEYSLKAAFLYNLAKFVNWPTAKWPQEDAPLVIGVVGEEGFERLNAVVKGKAIEKHKLVVRLLSRGEEVKDCHILFVTRSEKQPAELVKAAHQAAVLTVGETEEFLEVGGMIRFYLESDNLRLEINAEAVHQAGLSIKANALTTLINKGIAKLKKV